LEQISEVSIVTKPAFQAVGLEWEGTFAEAGAGGIRVVQTEIKNRLQEIKHVLHPDILLGLSHHIQAGRFTHYAVVEVEQAEDIPPGMLAVSFPAMTYAMCEHQRGQNIDASYTNIFAWIKQQGYELNKASITHFEEYPMAQEPYSKDPQFKIMIPVYA
jgi:predicted transcriptional regulator YdeE